MTLERGAIHYRARRKQLTDMRGMRIGTITPTDVDGLIDYHDKSFAFFELKHRDAALEIGQRLALERVVDAIAASGRRAALFVASHTVDNPGDDVIADLCLVRAIYESAAWERDIHGITLREAVDVFLGYGRPVPVFDPIRARGAVDPILRDPAYVQSLYEYLARTKSSAVERDPGEEG